jgi:hypothetical protein
VRDTKEAIASWARFCDSVQGEMQETAPPRQGRRGTSFENAEQRAKREARRHAAEYAFADALLQRPLDTWAKPKEVWSRPAHLPEDDGTLYWHLRIAAGPRAPKSSKEIASDYYSWRDEVLAVETHDAANVQLLLRVLCTLLDLPDRAGEKHAITIVSFIESQYAYALPQPLPRETGDPFAFRRVVYHCVRRKRLIPTWLLWAPTTKPPPGVRTGPPKGETIEGEIVEGDARSGERSEPATRDMFKGF